MLEIILQMVILTIGLLVLQIIFMKLLLTTYQTLYDGILVMKALNAKLPLVIIIILAIVVQLMIYFIGLIVICQYMVL